MESYTIVSIFYVKVGVYIDILKKNVKYKLTITLIQKKKLKNCGLSYNINIYFMDQNDTKN